MFNRWYILKCRKIIRIDNILDWAKRFEDKGDRIISRDNFGGVLVSTVFLGLDHSFSLNEDAPPILFETMVFGGSMDQYQERYATIEAAEQGHQEVLKKLRKSGMVREFFYDFLLYLKRRWPWWK